MTEYNNKSQYSFIFAFFCYKKGRKAGLGIEKARIIGETILIYP